MGNKGENVEIWLKQSLIFTMENIFVFLNHTQNLRRPKHRDGNPIIAFLGQSRLNSKSTEYLRKTSANSWTLGCKGHEMITLDIEELGV